MRNTRYTSLSFLITLAVLGTASARAADAPAQDERNELVVFGGISLLDADRSSQTTIDAGDIDMPGMGGFSFEAETSLGSSALFGARYSRLIKDRLALEADLTLAPSHELETRGSGCVAGFCIDAADAERYSDGRFSRGFGERSVTAWHYGAGLAYELTGGDVRPLVLLGAGGVTWDGARETGTDFVFRFGVGLKVLFGRVGARVDVVDHLVLDHFVSGEAEHDVHATAGLLVRF